MATYYVERIDVSWATVEANSPEEALKIANDNPELWDFQVGEPKATIED